VAVQIVQGNEFQSGRREDVTRGSGIRGISRGAASCGFCALICAQVIVDWIDRSAAYRGVTGAMAIILLRWSGKPLDGLRTLQAATPHPLIDLEIDRLTNPVLRPEGWNYLWFLGESEIYSAGQADEAAIHCKTACDAGILQHDIDLPFAEGTRLAWSWKVAALPSTLAEDILPTHDYLSNRGRVLERNRPHLLLERGATRGDGILVSVADVGEARVPRRGPKRHGRVRPLDRRGQGSVRRLCRARRKAAGTDPARLADREQYVSAGARRMLVPRDTPPARGRGGDARAVTSVCSGEWRRIARVEARPDGQVEPALEAHSIRVAPQLLLKMERSCNAVTV
jgi:Protein of unknown function (DUF3047)